MSMLVFRLLVGEVNVDSVDETTRYTLVMDVSTLQPIVAYVRVRVVGQIYCLIR